MALFDVCVQVSTKQAMDYIQYIPEHPGYYYNWIAPLQCWGMKWHPVKDVYSPPNMDASLAWIHLSVPEGVNIIPLSGNLEKKCEEFSAAYIYYRQDLNKIEIWAQDITSAVTKTSIYLNQFKSQNDKKKKLMPPMMVRT